MTTQEPIITIKNISKRYIISHERERYLTLRDAIMHFFRHPIRSVKEGFSREEFWALKDIDLTIGKGAVVGIIGHNGAGKSTLLKILSQVTPPTRGEIRIHGRIASLLEVGTGFHPELTGRENIYLNGAILGMSKKEIREKFARIVAFSGIEKFLDTPVKRYSSGMYVRLAFSVAAYLEPDILIVDEVLAVGDAAFQKKCLAKMEEITKKEGRTILFVSHNMAAIQQLCPRSILLEDGKVVAYDETEKVVARYLNDSHVVNETDAASMSERADARITKISIRTKDEKQSDQLPVNEDLFIDIAYEVFNDIDDGLICVLFYDAQGELLLLSTETDVDPRVRRYARGNYVLRVTVPAFLFNIGYHYFNVSIQRPFIEYIDHRQRIGFSIVDAPGFRLDDRWKSQGKMAAVLKYQTTVIEEEQRTKEQKDHA